MSCLWQWMTPNCPNCLIVILSLPYSGPVLVTVHGAYRSLVIPLLGGYKSRSKSRSKSRNMGRKVGGECRTAAVKFPPTPQDIACCWAFIAVLLFMVSFGCRMFYAEEALGFPSSKILRYSKLCPSTLLSCQFTSAVFLADTTHCYLAPEMEKGFGRSGTASANFS